MLCFVKDLKAAFIALAPRQNGMPMGRTAFQDFEIAYFLNLAYAKLFNQKVKILMEEVNKTFSSQGAPRRDMSFGPLLQEFGLLYKSNVHAEDWDPVDFPFSRYNLLWDEELSHIFEIVPINGFIPYILGCELFENYYARGIKGSRETTRNKGAKMSVTYPIRILNETEVLEYALLLRRPPNALPYRVGRVRADLQFSFTSAVDYVVNHLDKILTILNSGEDPLTSMIDRNQGRQQVYLLELLHQKMYANSVLTCSMQQIVYPEPISEMEITMESNRIVEVAFGYEIAEMAAQIATGNMGAQAPPPQQQEG